MAWFKNTWTFSFFFIKMKKIRRSLFKEPSICY